MACNLSNSFAQDCSRVPGGVSEFKVKVMPTDISAAGGYITSSGGVTFSSPATTGWYTYAAVLETGGTSFDPQTNRQNGSLFYQHMVNIIKNGLSQAFNNELSTLAKVQLHITVKLRSGVCLLFGYQNGMMLEPSTAGSGSASGDRNGYDLKFLSNEPDPPLVVSNYTALVTS